MGRATIRRTTRGMDTVDWIANLHGTQMVMDFHAKAIEFDANSLLMDHHVEGIAHIEVEAHDVDRFVSLVDSNNSNSETADSNSALSIEFGRAGYIDPSTGEKWGEMDGLFILTQAAGIRRRHGPKVKPKDRSKPARNKRGHFTSNK